MQISMRAHLSHIGSATPVLIHGPLSSCTTNIVATAAIATSQVPADAIQSRALPEG